MITKICVFLLLSVQNYVLITTYTHQNALHQTLWSGRCKKHDVVLNDCNWCRCNEKQRYQCEARVCTEIDMIGHFKDAIQEINVGMEGHGVWRSTPTACSPGVHYRRGAMLCVCNEDGNWPNPVCRDLLRVLHAVELTSLTQPTSNFTCVPTKLYVVGCNVCFCPSAGHLDPDLCTNNTCLNDDPILEANTTHIARSDRLDESLEIYASCKPTLLYSLGCMSCKCLRNNRLVCDTCGPKKRSAINEDPGPCHDRRPGDIFQDDCNFCYCDEKQRKICSVRQCLDKTDALTDVGKHSVNFISTTSPVDDEDCTPGTVFSKECNTCKCIKLSNGKKIIRCTVKLCDRKTPLDIVKRDCVLNTAYESKCMICNCEQVNGEKTQSCHSKPSCHSSQAPVDLKSLHGFCEPLRIYINGCNKCRCLMDGETLMCTTKRCAKRSDPISVEIVPVKRTQRDICPKGHSFKLKCNVCFCLSTSNAMCTTAKCHNKPTKINPIIH